LTEPIHSDARAETQPAAPKPPKKVRGLIYLKPEHCKGCGFCIAFCPPQVLKFSEAFNAQGYHPPVLADPERCTGCDLCGLYCPDFAIYGVMLKPAPAATTAASAAPSEAAR
jgi:2-oxoglutarate ferredoxin oxidoreductase subunit delta